MHLLAFCPNVSVFWNVNTHIKYRVDNVLDEVSIKYGYELHDHNFLLFNYILLVSKWHVYVRKLDNLPLCLISFLELLKEKVLLEKNIAFRNGKLKQFNERWEPIC